MRLLIALTSVCLIWSLTACGQGGGSDGGAASAQSVSGVYAAQSYRAGATYVVFAIISNGKLETRDYKFSGVDMIHATYAVWSYGDITAGTAHNLALTYATCQTLDGISAPPTEIDTITPLGNNQISVTTSVTGALAVLTQVSSVDETLAAMGMVNSLELTNCATQF